MSATVVLRLFLAMVERSPNVFENFYAIDINLKMAIKPIHRLSGSRYRVD